jgi:hypothetical protein
VRRPALLIFGTVLLFNCKALRADRITFEGLADGTPVTTQFAGLLFSNATALTAGISLNEFEFPPRSGSNVVFDDNGPITVDFSSPVVSFGGYFTYAESLTIQAFDTSLNPLASVLSPFSSNDAIFGDVGSSPNEFLSVGFASGISRVTITGDALGSSFAIDDLTYTPLSGAPSAVPEPSSLLILASTVLLIGSRIRRVSLIN